MTKLMRAICHVCGREVAVRNSGELREHLDAAPSMHQRKPAALCSGSGQHMDGVPVEVDGMRL